MSEVSPPTEAPKKDKKHKFVQYEHHGKVVSVREDLKGKHRSACLCFSCDKHKPEEPERCKIAYAVYQLSVQHGTVNPVWECPEFHEEGVKKETRTGVTGDVVK